MSTTIAPTRHSVVRHGREITVDLWPNGTANVYSKPINPATGKGWQASRDLQHFEGSKGHWQAMVAWLKAARQAGQ